METISIMRVNKIETADEVRIEIHDGPRIVFKGVLSLDNFALAITGRSEVPFNPKS